MKRILSLFALVFITVISCQKPEAVTIVEEKETTTFILVRHAEKAKDDPRNPSLSEEGSLRAESLAQHLSPMDIQGIYSTPFKRTITTVQPIADLKGLEVQTYNYQDSLLLQNFMKAHSGETIVISGHSNTTPVLVNQLIGEERFEWLNENEYDKLFIVTASEIGKGKVHILSY